MSLPADAGGELASGERPFHITHSSVVLAAGQQEGTASPKDLVKLRSADLNAFRQRGSRSQEPDESICG
jgi:hypothetical protein